MIGSIFFTKNPSIKKFGILKNFTSFEAVDRTKVLVVTGGRGKVASAVIQEAIKRGYDTYVTSRSTSRINSVNWVHINENEMLESKTWQNLFLKVSNAASSLSFINTIAVAIPPKGKSHQDINEKPVLAALHALKSLNIQTNIANISSIAATYLPNDPILLASFSDDGREYCLGRRKIDLILQDCGISTTIVRPGFVFTDVENDGSINTGHDYSPEQFTELLIHPIIGSGNQIHQPVYIGDVVQAVFNGLESNTTYVVDAVGPEVMTQKDTIKFFIELAGKPFRPINIPHEIVAVITKHVPKGRLAPYSGDLLKIGEQTNIQPLSTKPFENLVGRPLTAIGQIYPKHTMPFIFRRAPIVEHFGEIIACIANDPIARSDFLHIIKKYGPSLTLDAIKSFLIYNKNQ